MDGPGESSMGQETKKNIDDLNNDSGYGAEASGFNIPLSCSLKCSLVQGALEMGRTTGGHASFICTALTVPEGNT